MSYTINPDPGRGRGSGRVALIALGVVAVLALVAVAYLAGRGPGHDGQSASPGFTLPADRLSWSMVGGQPVPGSTTHGPAHTADGLAAGFSHDELGAALAAINISYRLTNDVGPVVYESTARQQCYGDINTLITQIRASPTSNSASSSTELYYKVISGDPTGDLVLVSIAAKTPQSAVAGGYGSFQRTLRWADGDWRLQVPVAPAQIVADVSSYHFLGRPDV